MRYAEQPLLLESGAHELQTDGQSVGIGAAWNADGTVSGKVGGDGVDVTEIHGQRVVRFISEAKGRRRCDGRCDHVDLVERAVKVVAN